jgi:hypothetical protein
MAARSLPRRVHGLPSLVPGLLRRGGVGAPGIVERLLGLGERLRELGSGQARPRPRDGLRRLRLVGAVGSGRGLGRRKRLLRGRNCLVGMRGGGDQALEAGLLSIHPQHV